MAVRQCDIYGTRPSPEAQTAERLTDMSVGTFIAVSGTAPGNQLLIQWDNTSNASDIMDAYKAIRERLDMLGRSRGSTALCEA